MKSVYDIINPVTQIFMYGIIIALVLTGLLAVVLSHTITRPIQALTTQAARITKGDFEEQVNIHSPDEIGHLSEVFNMMVVRLRESLTKQQRLEMTRKEFVANVSHELRTPLTTVKSYAEALQDSDTRRDDEVGAKFVEVIHSEAERMTRLVNDLLQLSKLDNKQAPLRLTEIDIVQFLGELTNRLAIQLEQNQIQCHIVIREKLAPVRLDRDQINQVLDNLLSNAIKYTPPEGSIRILVYRAGEDKIAIAIEDTGIGIPPEDLERIFERFYRVDKARSRSMGGTGLGLSIAREIVQAHGGDVQITSTLHVGTTVTVILPYLTTAQTSVQALTPTTMENMRGEPSR